MTEEEFDHLRLAVRVARDHQVHGLKELRYHLRRRGLSTEAIEKAIAAWHRCLVRQGIDP